jgi:hypothetical protein
MWVQRRCFGSALEEIVVYGSSFVHSTDMVLKDAPKWARKVRCSESLQCFRTPVGSSSISLAMRLKAAADTIIVASEEVKKRKGQGVRNVAKDERSTSQHKRCTTNISDLFL